MPIFSRFTQSFSRFIRDINGEKIISLLIWSFSRLVFHGLPPLDSLQKLEIRNRRSAPKWQLLPSSLGGALRRPPDYSSNLCPPKKTVAEYGFGGRGFYWKSQEGDLPGKGGGGGGAGGVYGAPFFGESALITASQSQHILGWFPDLCGACATL